MYSDQPAYSTWIGNMAEDMVANKRVIRQYQKIKNNLHLQVEECEIDYETYQTDCKLREDARIYYDHYRLKM